MKNEFIVPIGLMVSVTVMVHLVQTCLRKPKVLCRRFCDTAGEEGCIQKLFYCLIPIKEPCVRKYEGLPRSKILGILQTETMDYLRNN